MTVKKNQQAMAGFTLIELMVVVAIISILATLALPKFEQFQQKTILTEGIEMVSSIKESIALFRIENSASPLTSGGALGAVNINTLGLLVKVPEKTRFEFFITGNSSPDVPANSDNLRVGGRYPAGINSNSLDSLSLNSNELGVQFFKLQGTTNQTPY